MLAMLTALFQLLKMILIVLVFVNSNNTALRWNWIIESVI